MYFHYQRVNRRRMRDLLPLLHSSQVALATIRLFHKTLHTIQPTLSGK